MEFTIKRQKRDFKIVVNDDLTATINDQPAYFDPKYNAVILNDGELDLTDVNGIPVKGLRVDGSKCNQIIKSNEEFKQEYEKIFKRQKKYIPTTVKYTNNKFTYDNIDNINVTTSDVVEKLNLLIAGNKELHNKVCTMVNDEGYIQTDDLIKLPEYIDYIKEIKKYEKMQKNHLKLKDEFEELIADKQGVGLTECNGCGELTIIGDGNRKFLPKLMFYDARNDWCEIDGNRNKYNAFCLGISDQFYFVKVGNTDQCKSCRLDE